MPVRTRRVRLIAVALCIATVFYLYTRNEDQVERYTGYLRQSTVGGGSVLRSGSGDQKQEPIRKPPPPAADPFPPLPTTSTREAFVDPLQTTTTPLAILDTAFTSTTSSSSAPKETAQLQPNELPVEVGQGRVEEDPATLRTTSTSAIHWSKLPEKFPVTSTIQLPSGKPSAIPLVQKQGNTGADKERLAAVREATQWAWKGFRDEGWGYDEVKPVSGGGQNSFNGWGATLVDGLDTLWIMGLKDEFEEAVRQTMKIDFTTSSRNDIPLFEVTIRYLGGMVAAYDVSGRVYTDLLEKAVELAEILYSAFDTPNRMPDTYYHWKPTYAGNPHRASTRAVMAEIGTLSLEFTRLAQLTGEPKYYDAIARITDAFQEWQNRTRVPGMWPTDMDASGCKRPIKKKPTGTLNQVPVQGGGLSRVGAPSKIDPSLAANAKNALSKSKTPADDVDTNSLYDGMLGVDKSKADTPTNKVDSPPDKNAAQAGSHPAQPGYNPASEAHGSSDSAHPKFPSSGHLGSSLNGPDPARSGLDAVPNPANHDLGEMGSKLGSVANVANPMAMNANDADSATSLRHSMAEHPANKPAWPQKVQNPAVQGKKEPVSNSANAKGPLPPKAEAANQGVDPKVVPYGHKEGEPLPPQGVGESPINKRQLDIIGEPGIESNNATKANATTLHHQDLRQLDTSVTDDEEPECVPQGFESVSKNSPEAFTLGGKSDSTYEYLPKMHLLVGGRFDQYKDMYLESMKPITEKLFYRPMTPDNADILVSGEVVASVNFTTGAVSEKLLAKGEHLTCFAGGMVAMGGKLFNVPEHVELGRKLTDGCVWTYNATATGIMPESFQMLACESQQNCKWNKTLYYETLDPMVEWREDTRADFAKMYDISDLEAYEKKLAAESAAEGTAYAIQTAPADLDEYSITPGIRTAAAVQQVNKRQLVDASLDPPAPRPVEAPSVTESSVIAVDNGPDSNAPWGTQYDAISQHSHDSYDYEQPVRPVQTPAPPLTHQAYVDKKLADEGLPTGFIRIDGRGYILRPEAIESVFYMYRITGEQYWRDMGWKMFTSIDKATRAPFGHASVGDVTSSEPSLHDKMESFWIAETLKYFYLLFDEPGNWSLDDWVLNTEAHFFRRPDNPIEA